MSPEAERIMNEISRLPRDERVAVYRWMQTTDVGDDAHDGFADGDVRAAWEREVDRRIDDADAGRGESIPSDQVRREVRGIIDGFRKD